MSDQRGLPPAPPLPPWHPPKNNTLMWVIGAIMLVLAVIVPLGGIVAFAYVYGGHDRIELIDKPETVKALAPTCARVGANAAELHLEGAASVRAAALMEFADVAREIPSVVEGFTADHLDSDIPTAEWGADWTTLLTELDRYAKALSAGEPASFEMPSTPDGFSIVGRMNLASPLRGCNVPRAITSLDSDPPRLP